MEKKKRFPLILRDDYKVRSLDDIQEHFDLEKIIGYLESGELFRWLDDRYYEEEAEKISGLDFKSETLPEELCEVFYIEKEKAQNIVKEYREKHPEKFSVKSKVNSKKGKKECSSKNGYKSKEKKQRSSNEIPIKVNTLENTFKETVDKEWEKNPIEEQIRLQLEKGGKEVNHKTVLHANMAFVCACISLCILDFPVFSAVVAVLGLVLSRKTQNAIKKKRSKFAQILCMIVIVVDISGMISLPRRESESNQTMVENTAIHEINTHAYLETTESEFENLQETVQTEPEVVIDQEIIGPEVETIVDSETTGQGSKTIASLETTESELKVVTEPETIKLESETAMDFETIVEPETKKNSLQTEESKQILETELSNQKNEMEITKETIQAGTEIVLEIKPYSTVEGTVKIVINDAYFKDDMPVIEPSELSLIEENLKEGYTAVFIDYTVSILESDGLMQTKELLAEIDTPKKYWGYVTYNDDMTSTMREKMGLEMKGYLEEGETFHLVRGFELPKELLEEGTVCTIEFPGNEEESFELLPDQLSDYTGKNPW